MAMVSFGDLAQSFLLKSQTARLKGEAGRVSQELSSGRVSDVGSIVSGDFSQLSALSRSRAVIEGYQTTARAAATSTAAAQATISTIAENVQALVAPLLATSQLGSVEQIALTATEARARLNDVVSALNTSIGGRALFSGIDVKGPAVSDAETILSALRMELVGVASAQSATDRISDWFDRIGGYDTTAYQGDSALADVAVSPTERIWLGATANDPDVRSVLKGLAGAALISDPGLPLQNAELKAYARLTAETLIAGDDSLTNLAARIGISQSRIDAAQSRNATELMTIEMAQADLVQSDPYRLASELEAIQTNLETVFAITARLSRLTLTDFLR
ncbi:MAG: flagellin [Paracoccaceae bacterium]